MATVSPNPSDREIIDGVCGGKITPEKACELLRGDGDAKIYLLQKLAAGNLPLAVGVQLEARLRSKLKARPMRYFSEGGLGCWIEDKDWDLSKAIPEPVKDEKSQEVCA